MDDLGRPSLGLNGSGGLLCVLRPAQQDGQGITDHHSKERRCHAELRREVRVRWVGLAPRRRCVVTVRTELGSGPFPLSPEAGAPPYLGGPIAMNQDRKGVVSQVPRSHVAHFELEHDLI